MNLIVDSVVEALLREKLEDKGIEVLRPFEVSAAIIVHVGPDALAVSSWG